MTQDRINVETVAKSFGQAAKTYDKAALLQHEVARRLCQRLDFMHISPQTIVDLGCGTGYIHSQLAQRFPKASLIGLDIAEGMLQQRAAQGSGSTLICGDAQSIPLQDNSVDLIFSNLMIHWCSDIDAVFREVTRILRPNGLLIYSSLGPDTLYELRSAFAKVDTETHVHSFRDMHDYGDLMMAGALSDPVTDMERIVVHYDQVNHLMRDLKQIGAHNLHPGRRKTLTGKQTFLQLSGHYETYRNAQQKLPATYEVIYGHAWGSEASPELINAAKEVNIPIETLKSMLKQGALT